MKFRQTAFGSDWIVKTSGTKETLNDVKFFGDQLGWVVGVKGLILHTTDSGNTWVKQRSPTSANLTKVFFINSLIGWAVGDSGKILKTTNGGTYWELKNSNVTSTITSLQFLNENLGWASAKSTTSSPLRAIVLKTTDGGNSWFASATIRFEPTSLHFTNANNGIIGSQDGPSFAFSKKLQKTTDGGITWTGFYPQNWDGTIKFTFADNLLNGILSKSYWDMLGRIIYITSDGGATWIQNSIYSGYDYYSLGGFHINSQGYAWILLVILILTRFFQMIME